MTPVRYGPREHWPARVGANPLPGRTWLFGTVRRMGLRQSLFAPGAPINGVIGVLKEVGARLVDQAVGHGLLESEA